MITNQDVRIARLEAENALLRKTIEIQMRQMKGVATSDDKYRRLRARLAEWEGSMPKINGVYHHGSKVILPFIDEEDV